jgi:hypothetical protein
MRRAIVSGFVAVLGLMWPAAAPAFVTLGKADLSGTSGVQFPCQLNPGGCTTYNVGVAAGGTLNAPFDGVIVRWRLKLGDAGPDVSLRVLNVSGGNVTGVRSDSPVSTVTGLNQWTTRLPISSGQTVGFDQPTFDGGVSSPFVGVLYTSASGASDVHLNPKLSATETRAAPAAEAGVELFFAADVEPDADHDGFGDETQDGCSTNPASQSPCPAAPPDKTAPSILGDPSAKRSGKRGTIFTYVLSEAATVTFTIQRRTSGRKVKGRCVKRTKRNAKKRSCARYRKVGTFTHKGAQGENKKTFSGRIGKRALRAGRYRATLTAVDAAGNVSKSKSVAFRVRKKKRAR